METFGIDVWDDALMRSRPWMWLARRIASLLDRPPTMLRYEAGDLQKFATLPSTRLGWLLNPPKLE